MNSHSHPTEGLSILPSAKKVFLKRQSLSFLLLLPWNFHTWCSLLTSSFWIIDSVEQPNFSLFSFQLDIASLITHSHFGNTDCRQSMPWNLGILFLTLELELSFFVCLGGGIKDHGQKSRSWVYETENQRTYFHR